MPHTNRKKKAGSTVKKDDKKPMIVHTKRKEVEDEEGWTHIVDTPRARSSTLKKNANTSLLHGGDFEINGVSYINRTLEELKADYEYWKKSWEESDACTELKTKATEVWEGKKPVNNVVVLGLGSLQSSRREGRRASATQLAALQSIVQTLGGEMEVSCQDPQFTELDEQFLVSLGYGIVKDPEAFKLVNEGSLVYAIHCYAKVYKAVSEAPRPAVLIGTDVGNFGRFDTSDTIEDVAKSLESLVAGCKTIDFPQIRHDFSDTKLYWRSDSPVVKEEAVAPSVEPVEVNEAALLQTPESTEVETASIETPITSPPEETSSAEVTKSEPSIESLEPKTDQPTS